MNPIKYLRILVSPYYWKVMREGDGEKDAKFYDTVAKYLDVYDQHYTESSYYFLWSVLADRMLHGQVHSVLDVGCGTGQMASLLRDKGLAHYHGFDFSQKRIEMARKVCPEYTFSHADAFTTDLFQSLDYDTVICQEFLEHVEKDTDVLARIRPGSRFYGSVPNFPNIAHVRHFQNAEEVRTRYAPYFDDLRVDTFLRDTKGITFFLMEGIKK